MGKSLSGLMANLVIGKNVEIISVGAMAAMEMGYEINVYGCNSNYYSHKTVVMPETGMEWTLCDEFRLDSLLESLLKRTAKNLGWVDPKENGRWDVLALGAAGNGHETVLLFSEDKAEYNEPHYHDGEEKLIPVILNYKDSCGYDRQVAVWATYDNIAKGFNGYAS